ncbi:MAG: deoxyhypusine synthase family protein, partial [Myxococcota bacterium]
MTTKREPKKYGTGHDDGLEPLVPLDIGRLDSVNALVSAMANTAFGGRRLGEAADALEEMVRDEDCFRVVTISGAMTIAKQGLVLCEMIERGWVQAIVATGALMTHGVVEGAGLLHF